MKRRVKSIIVFASLLVVGVLFVSPICFGGWVFQSSSGTWTTVSDVEWLTPSNSESASAVYEYEDFNMSEGQQSWAFSLSIDQDTWFDWGQFWVGHRIIHNVEFNLTGVGGKKIRIKFRGATDRNLGTLGIDEKYFSVWWAVDNDAWTHMHTDEERNNYRVYFFKNGATSLNMTVLYLFERDGGTHRGYWFETERNNVTWTVPSGWFDDVTITQKMYKGDSGVHMDGWIGGFKDSESFNVEGSVSETKGAVIDYWKWFADNLSQKLYDLLPDWLQDFVDGIFSFFSPLVDLLASVWAVVLTVIPLLPYVFLAWIADAGATSVKKGSLVPLGYCFSAIFGTAQAIGTWLVALAHAFWDLITFWS